MIILENAGVSSFEVQNRTVDGNILQVEMKLVGWMSKDTAQKLMNQFFEMKGPPTRVEMSDDFSRIEIRVD